MLTDRVNARRSIRWLGAAVVLLVSLSLLSGCGWRLQGSYRLPDDMTVVYLESFDRYSELTRLVRERMRLQSITVVNEPDNELPTILLRKDNLYRRTLTFFRNGQTAEYELNYRVEAEIRRPGLRPYFFQMTATREYQDNPDKPLAKTREVELLLVEMRQDIADLLVREMSRTDTYTAQATAGDDGDEQYESYNPYEELVTD